MDHIDHIDHIADLWARERPELDLAAFQVVGRILRLSRFLQRQEEQVANAFGINASEYRILCALRRAGEPCRLPPGELVASLLVTSGAITKRIDRLEQLGYVERQADPSDRRAQLIELTDSGRNLIDQLIVADTQEETRAVAPLKPADLAELTRLLRILLSATENGTDPPLTAHPGRPETTNGDRNGAPDVRVGARLRAEKLA